MSLTLKKVIDDVPRSGRVLDVGCLGFNLVELTTQAGLGGVRHSGVDFIADPQGLPDDFDYRVADLNRDPLPFDDDAFDLVVAAQMIEHVRDPIELVAECLRVLKPGGTIYIEAPSERTLWLPGFPIRHEQFRSWSFYDDPTHCSRPWSPQAFYRLAAYFGCEIIESRHVISWPTRLLAPLMIPFAWLTRNDKLLESTIWLSVGWTSYVVARKPSDTQGRPKLKYFYPSTRN